VIAVTMPIVTAFKFCIRHRKNELLNRQPGEVNFLVFLTRFLHREWHHQSLAGGAQKRFLRAAPGVAGSRLPWHLPRCPGIFCVYIISYHYYTASNSSLAPGHCVQGYIVNMHECVQQKIGRRVQGHVGVRHYYYGNYVIYNKKSESRCGCV
jgi:hypothetical protein